MLIFIYGKDTYSSCQKLNELIEHYKKTHKSGLNLKYYQCGQDNFEKLRDEFQQMPMFEEKKLFVLKNIFSNQEFKNSFLKNSKKFLTSNNIILIQQEGEINSKDSLFNFLKKNSKIQEFQLLQGQKLRNWIKKEFTKYSSQVESQAVELLINFTGNNLWQLSNEIKKLVAFKGKKTVSAKDVQALVKPKVETDIFKTIDAIAFKNKKLALSLLHKHFEKGDSHLYVLAMVNFQIRNLLTIKSGAKLKGHPYVIRKTSQQVKFFSLPELKKIHRKLFEADYNIKTGRLDSKTALELLIAEI